MKESMSMQVVVVPGYYWYTMDTLQKIQEFYLAGRWPRHFAIQDNLMVVADQKHDTTQLLEIDADSGQVSHLTEFQTAPWPTFVCFV